MFRLMNCAYIVLMSVFSLVCLSMLCACSIPINSVTIKLSIADDVFVYDGQIHESSGIIGAHSDGTIEMQDDEGEHYIIKGLYTKAFARIPAESIKKVVVQGRAQVIDSNGEDVTNKCLITVEPGSLIIKPRDLKLVSYDCEKEFDGKPLKDTFGRLKSVEGFVGDDSAACEFISQQIVPGTCQNDFKLIWGHGTDSSCYNVQKILGTLRVRVRDKDDKLQTTIKGSSDSVVFDGKAHTIDAFDDKSFNVSVNDVKYVVTGISQDEIKGTKPGTYKAELCEGENFGVYLKSDKKREHNLALQFDIEMKPSVLKIEKPALYVGTFFTSDYDWTDSVFVSRDCETFKKIGEVPLDMRDPSIIWHDGWFYVMACRNDVDGKLWLELCASQDLKNWTERHVSGPFSLDQMPDIGAPNFDVVAPEWFEDKDGSLHVIVSCGWWGATHGVPTDDHMQAYLLDIFSLSVVDGVAQATGGVAKKLSVNVDGADRIDGTIDIEDGFYWLTIKRNGLTMECWKNKKLSATGWARVDERNLYGFEAPCIVKVNDMWSLFADGVPDVEPYGVRRWTAKTIQGAWNESTVIFLDKDGTVFDVRRHGTVLAVPSEQTAAWNAINELVS